MDSRNDNDCWQRRNRFEIKCPKRKAAEKSNNSYHPNVDVPSRAKFQSAFSYSRRLTALSTKPLIV
jgi:hypothetical protein